jgi:hypothetical protein
MEAPQEFVIVFTKACQWTLPKAHYSIHSRRLFHYGKGDVSCMRHYPSCDEDVLGSEGRVPSIFYFGTIWVSGKLDTPAAFTMVKQPPVMIGWVGSGVRC